MSSQGMQTIARPTGGPIHLDNDLVTLQGIIDWPATAAASPEAMQPGLPRVAMNQTSLAYVSDYLGIDRELTERRQLDGERLMHIVMLHFTMASEERTPDQTLIDDVAAKALGWHKKPLGLQLKHCKTVLDLSDQQMASLLRVSRTTIHSWQNQNVQLQAESQRSLTRVMLFTLLWEHEYPQGSLKHFLFSDVAGRTLPELIHDEASDIDQALVDHVRGIREAAQQREEEDKERVRAEAEGYEPSSDLFF